MNFPLIKSLISFLYAPLTSPRGLFSRSLQVALAFLIIHLCGLREYTSFISGTSPTGEPLTLQLVMLGALYLLSFFAFALLTPILAIGALLLWGMQKIGSPKKSGRSRPAQGIGSSAVQESIPVK